MAQIAVADRPMPSAPSPPRPRSPRHPLRDGAPSGVETVGRKLSARPRSGRARHRRSAPSCRAPPRCGSAGCTWPRARPARCARLDLTGAGRDREVAMKSSLVSPERWLMTVPYEARSRLRGVEGLGQGADLVELDEHRVGDVVVQWPGGRLGFVTRSRRRRAGSGRRGSVSFHPTRPLGEAVLDRRDGKLADPVFPVRDHLGGSAAAIRLLEDDCPSWKNSLAAGSSASTMSLPGAQPRGADGRENDLDGLDVRPEVRREAPLVPHAGRVALRLAASS